MRRCRKAETNVVRDFRIGNTRIRIADDYCAQTEEEVERILKSIAERAQRHLINAAENYGQREDQEASNGNR